MNSFRLYLTLFLCWIASSLCGQEAVRTRYTNLPTIYVETFNKVSITSKTTYVYATMWYVDENDVVTRYDSLQIRGRGNSTWKLNKKPYRIKFHSKEKLLGKGYAKAKSWTLLANAGDKSLMRNAVTSSMAEFMGMDFCPAYKFVDFNLNGVYLGNYQLSDQVDVRPHRVDVEEQDWPLTESSDITGGYLLEVDGFKEKNYFTTSRGLPIRIHYPDEEEIGASQNNYIRTYIRNFETTLFGSTFTDPQRGYRAWVDSTSLSHLVIGNEVSANLDGYWSTYFYKEQQDSLLYWGPLWDYDIAYSNDNRDRGTVNSLMTDVGFGETKIWINRMWADPWFARLINRRYAELLDAGLVEHMHATIDSLATLLDESQQLNYQKWGISTRMYHEIVLYSSYEQYLTDLRNFIVSHAAYLVKAFANKLPQLPGEPEEPEQPAEPTPEFVPGNYYYRLVNAGKSSCFDLSEITVCGWESDLARPTQEWQIIQVGNYYHLINRATGLALNDPTEGAVGPTVNTGTQLNVAVADTLDDRQLWVLTPQGSDGLYNITNKYTQHTANLKGGSAANATPILSYTTDDRNASSQNRQWRILPGTELPEVEEPEIPEEPEVPDTPEEPEEPELPEVPDTPEEPEEPEVPDTPDTPEEPEEPEVPDTPEEPEVPEIPEDPEDSDAVHAVEPDEYALAYNPHAQLLHFGSETPELLTFKVGIYSQQGDLLHLFRADESFSVAHLPSGLYIVSWQCGGHRRSVKFVK